MINHQASIPANWDEHLEGTLPGEVFCDDLFCWCHEDQRKLAFVGNAAQNNLVEENQMALIIDGLVPVSPQLLMLEAIPTGFITPDPEEEDKA